MMMRNGNKVLVIGLVLLAGFASSASAVTKGMKKVVEDALDFSVRQSMSLFGEMKDQKGEGWRDDYLRFRLVDKWFLSRYVMVLLRV